MFNLDAVTDALADATFDDLEEIIIRCREQIKRYEDEEVAEIDQDIARLQARRDKIRHPHKKNGSRNYQEIVNPDNPNEVYRTGPKPAWAKELMKKMKELKEMRKNGGDQ